MATVAASGLTSARVVSSTEARETGRTAGRVVGCVWTSVIGPSSSMRIVPTCARALTSQTKGMNRYKLDATPQTCS
ncbi:hypothetical protein GCM10020369_15760 [Cryptosporangium minutisporangium]|uniref:Secreted protein n=1 Tax=Cryptosporangium minutisporangium TaxID=113569 RepID=A0ABP6SSX6_9ACTN